jgi:hypothetical protein
MIHARVHNGQLEFLTPLPDDWEGCEAEIEKSGPLTGEELAAFEANWAAFKAVGPAEFEPGEWEDFQREWKIVEDKDRENTRRLMNGAM